MIGSGDPLEISQILLDKTSEDATIVPMHYGAPFYDFLSDISIEEKQRLFSKKKYSALLKEYERSAGSYTLRKSICDFYLKKYNLKINPDEEIIITNGSVEAFALSLLCTTNIGDVISITDPTYSSFVESIKTLGRCPHEIKRPSTKNEYEVVGDFVNKKSKCLVVNSPENPTGYVLSSIDWQHIRDRIVKTEEYLIHDEILSELSFHRTHKPATSYDDIRDRTILINGFSKIFGLPGIKIGWMIANHHIIKKARKHHMALYLGVNSASEHIASFILNHRNLMPWLSKYNVLIKNRLDETVKLLNSTHGFIWSRMPYGGLCVTPQVLEIYRSLPKKYQHTSLPTGAAVASYFLAEKHVSVTPGCFYGSQLDNHIKIAICHSYNLFQEGMKRLI